LELIFMNITWIGQSGYILKDEKNEICIDPYLSDIVEKVAGRKRMVECPVPPKDLKSDAVICTHNHLDHLDPDAIREMDLENKIFYAPSDCMEQLEQLGVKNKVAFNVGDRATVGNFEMEAVFADHTVPAIGVVIRHRGKTLYFSGDTYYNKKLEELKNYSIDCMFICINGKLGNMNVDEAVQLTKIIGPKVGIPNHYGMFASNTEDPCRYTSQLKNGFEMEFNRTYSIEEILRSDLL